MRGGNRVEIVQYDQVQLMRTLEIQRGMGREFGKTHARSRLGAKGLAP
jgi:hypothetical protein